MHQSIEHWTMHRKEIGIKMSEEKNTPFEILLLFTRCYRHQKKKTSAFSSVATFKTYTLPVQLSLSSRHKLLKLNSTLHMAAGFHDNMRIII